MASDESKADPGVVLDLLESFRRSKTMFAAVSLGIFDALAAGPKSLSALAEELEARSRRARTAARRLRGVAIAQAIGGVSTKTRRRPAPTSASRARLA